MRTVVLAVVLCAACGGPGSGAPHDPGAPAGGDAGAIVARDGGDEQDAGNVGAPDASSSDAGGADAGSPQADGGSHAGGADAGSAECIRTSECAQGRSCVDGSCVVLCSRDADCNGLRCENNVCRPIALCGLPCYSGPPGTQGVGSCRAGRYSCDANAVCTGEQVPSAEQCNGFDDDCNGSTDDVPPSDSLADPVDYAVVWTMGFTPDSGFFDDQVAAIFHEFRTWVGRLARVPSARLALVVTPHWEGGATGAGAMVAADFGDASSFSTAFGRYRPDNSRLPTDGYSLDGLALANQLSWRPDAAHVIAVASKRAAATWSGTDSFEVRKTALFQSLAGISNVELNVWSFDWQRACSGACGNAPPEAWESFVPAMGGRWETFATGWAPPRTGQDAAAATTAAPLEVLLPRYWTCQGGRYAPP